eukprot:2146263-Pleurochrysis_carterae.AAC.3
MKTTSTRCMVPTELGAIKAHWEHNGCAQSGRDGARSADTVRGQALVCKREPDLIGVCGRWPDSHLCLLCMLCIDPRDDARHHLLLQYNSLHRLGTCKWEAKAVPARHTMFRL